MDEDGEEVLRYLGSLDVATFSRAGSQCVASVRRPRWW